MSIARRKINHVIHFANLKYDFGHRDYGNRDTGNPMGWRIYHVIHSAERSGTAIYSGDVGIGIYCLNCADHVRNGYGSAFGVDHDFCIDACVEDADYCDEFRYSCCGDESAIFLLKLCQTDK